MIQEFNVNNKKPTVKVQGTPAPAPDRQQYAQLVRLLAKIAARGLQNQKAKAS